MICSHGVPLDDCPDRAAHHAYPQPETVHCCDVGTCPRLATWAYIGEGGDLYLCDDHHHDAPNWHRIPT